MNNIEELNRLAKQSPIDFVNQLKEYAEKLKAEEKSMSEATNILIGGLKADLEKRLKEKESSVKGLYEKEIKEKKETIAEKDKLVVRISGSLVKEKEENYSRFAKIKDSLDKKAKRSAEIKLWFIIGFYILEFLVLVFCTFKFGWPIMAPFVSFIGSGSVILGYVYFAVTKKELNPITIYKNNIESNKERNYKKFGFDIQHFRNLEKELAELKSKSKDK